MAKYVLVNAGTRRSKIDPETKIRAIADVEKGKTAGAVLKEVYDAIGDDPPKNVSICLSNWRKSILKMCNDGKENVIKLAVDYGIVKKEEDKRQR